MKIATTKTTVRDLLALLNVAVAEGDADLSDEVSFARATKKQPVPCWCGCGGTTKSRFVPGHDSRFHGLAKRVARGQANHDEAIASLPHDKAVTEFERHVADEQPVWALKQQEKAEKKTAREAEKAARKAEKAASVEHELIPA